MPKRRVDDPVDVPTGKKPRKGVDEEEEFERPMSKTLVNPKMQRDGEGNEFWQISKLRRVQVSDFKGQIMVSIREYYEKDGKKLPGKKGISLPIEQVAAVLSILPDLEGVLQSKGIAIPRPNYDRTAVDEDGDGEQNEEDGHDAPAPKGRLDTSAMRKANHEATDDEDDDG